MNRFQIFTDSLREKLCKPLPGLEAQLRMTSLPRMRELMNFTIREDAQPSGVLILFYPVDSKIYTVFILRPTYDGVHSGQVSLPGGKREAADQDITETALREAAEEIGVDAADVVIIGKLTDLYIPPSNFLVTPVVGYTFSRPSFRIDPFEVEKIIEADISLLLDNPTIKQLKITVRDGMEIETPAFIMDGNIIWGATAMIISELREIVNG